ncbi:MAG: hypothetical protein LBE61_12860 [Burkholderiaceae bacterium]|jgi:hypothetical protein|nr:hypothetical protein [Burkholderiaceae bacterium]
MFKKIIIAGAMLGWGLAHAFAPQAGTWVVTAENNGRPGRGFGLDVQNGTLVMQMYAYDTSGYPMFYLSAGPLANNAYSGVLNKYRDGRYFGSGDRIGREDGNAGTVSMRFISGTKGYITFPNEPEKEISRFNFGYTNAAAQLRGIWMLSSVSPNGSAQDKLDYFSLTDAVRGSDYGTGAMASRDRTYSCENLTSGPNSGLTMCLKYASDGTAVRVNFFHISINDGEGWAGPTPQSADDVLYVKRVAGPNGDFTGIYYKDQPVEESAELQAAKLQARQDAAAQPIDRRENKDGQIDILPLQR